MCPDMRGDTGNRVVRIGEKAARGTHTLFREILLRRCPGPVMEDDTEAGGAEMRQIGQIGDRDARVVIGALHNGWEPGGNTATQRTAQIDGGEEPPAEAEEAARQPVADQGGFRPRPAIHEPPAPASDPSPQICEPARRIDRGGNRVAAPLLHQQPEERFERRPLRVGQHPCTGQGEQGE